MAVAKSSSSKNTTDFSNVSEHKSDHIKSGTYDKPKNIPATGASGVGSDNMSSIKNAGYSNQVTITKDGKSSTVTGYISGGVTYVENKDGSGTRLVGANAQNKYDDISSMKGGYVNGQYTTNIVLKDSPKSSSSSSYEEYYYDPPPPPPRPTEPTYQSFNKVKPSITSDLQKVHKFSYFFGIDKISMEYVHKNLECCYISEDIEVGIDSEIMLDVDYKLNGGSIEFFIIDGIDVVPILSIDEESIFDEKLINELRFELDKTKSIEIKENMKSSNLTIEQAIDKENITISYTPKNIESLKRYTTKSDKIQIKAIIRAYSTKVNAPFINNINIRKFGGNALWQNNMFNQ